MAIYTNTTKNTSSYSNINKNSSIYSNQGKVYYEQFLLLEDGGILLLEDSGKIILDQSIRQYTINWNNLAKT